MRKSTERVQRPYVIGLLLALYGVLLGACGGGVEGSYFYGEGDEGITLELRGGDVAVISISGLSSVQGKYSVDGDTVTVTMSDGDVDVFTLRDGDLATTGFGESMIFKKQ